MGTSLLIVGGGVMGHVTALLAARNDPRLDITLVERDRPGSGASSRSAGLHFPIGRSPRVRALSRASQLFYEGEMRQRSALPIRPLTLRIHCDAGKADWLASIVTTGASLQRCERAPAVADPFARRCERWTATGAHQALVGAYIRWIRHHLSGRVRFVEGTRVLDVDVSGRQAVARTADGQALRADHVVLSPGPFALAREFQPFVRSLSIRIKRVVAFHLDEPCPALEPGVDLFVEDDAFLMPRADGQGRVFSFTSEEWDVDPHVMAGGATKRDRDAAGAVLSRVAPGLSSRLCGAQAFCDAYSANREPIVAPLVGAPGAARIVLAGAANGSGYRLAPAMATEALGQLGLMACLETA